MELKRNTGGNVGSLEGKMRRMRKKQRPGKERRSKKICKDGNGGMKR